MLTAVLGGRKMRRLLATGTRAESRMVAVDAGRFSGTNGGTRYYQRPIVLAIGGEDVHTEVVVPETLQALVVAGAPCELVFDPADRRRVCLVSITNAFGVKQAVQIGSP